MKLAFVAGVSYGLYAGPHSVRIAGDFVEMVNEVCSELLKRGGGQQEQRCITFDTVIFVRLKADGVVDGATVPDTDTGPAGSTNKTNKSKSKILMIFVIVVAVVLSMLAAIGARAYLWYPRH